MRFTVGRFIKRTFRKMSEIRPIVHITVQIIILTPGESLLWTICFGDL